MPAVGQPRLLSALPDQSLGARRTNPHIRTAGRAAVRISAPSVVEGDPPPRAVEVYFRSATGVGGTWAPRGAAEGSPIAGEADSGVSSKLPRRTS